MILICFIRSFELATLVFGQSFTGWRRVRGQLRFRSPDFEDAFNEIVDHLEKGVKKGSKGMAIYSRWGDRPFFLPLEFGVPLETRLVVDDLSHIYPVVETKGR